MKFKGFVSSDIIKSFCSQFFQKGGVIEAMNIYELFNSVTGLNLTISGDDEAEFIAQVTHSNLVHKHTCRLANINAPCLLTD